MRALRNRVGGAAHRLGRARLGVFEHHLAGDLLAQLVSAVVERLLLRGELTQLRPAATVQTRLIDERLNLLTQSMLILSELGVLLGQLRELVLLIVASLLVFELLQKVDGSLDGVDRGALVGRGVGGLVGSQVGNGVGHRAGGVAQRPGNFSGLLVLLGLGLQRNGPLPEAGLRGGEGVFGGWGFGSS